METNDDPKTRKEALDEIENLIKEIDKLQEDYEKSKVDPPKTTTFKVNVKTVSDGEIKTITNNGNHERSDKRFMLLSRQGDSRN